MQMKAILVFALFGLSCADPEHKKIPPSEVDVFVPVHHANCVTSKMVEHLNIYLQPRRILIATSTENCPTVSAYAENVRCMDEDKVLAGNVTKQGISSKIDEMLKLDVADSQFGYGGHSTSGWYLQQFLKLGVVDSPLLVDEPLSEVYLVWDSDMILVNQFELYDAEGRIPLMAGGKKHSFSFLQVGSAAEQEVELADSCNYHVVFKRLTGMDTVNAPGGRGYVPHHMVMRKSYVHEMLGSFGGKEEWVWNVLKASCGKGSDYAFCQCGFSEYYSMASFLKRRHPHAVFDRESNYTRYRSRSCCPYNRHFKKNTDKLFIGFEQGNCGEEGEDADESDEGAPTQQQNALRR